eukprot:8926596-Pyramimonas_sp.AAC.1
MLESTVGRRPAASWTELDAVQLRAGRSWTELDAVQLRAGRSWTTSSSVQVGLDRVRLDPAGMPRRVWMRPPTLGLPMAVLALLCRLPFSDV